jgi:O-antigen ligase
MALETIATRALQSPFRGRLGIIYKLTVLAYMLAVVLLSYRDGLTFFAKGAGLLLIGLFVFRAIAAGEKVFLPAEYKLLFAWLLIGLVSSGISDSPETALARVMTLLQVFPLAFVLSNFIVWNADTRFYWLSLVATAALSGVVALAYPGQFADLDGRVFGTLANANAFAALLAVGVGLCLAALLGTRSFVLRVACLGLAAFFLYLIGRTGSRMGMLASVAAIVSVALCFQVSRNRKGVGRAALLLAFGALIVAGAVVYFADSEFSGRLAALQSSIATGDFRSSGDTSLYGRARLYKKAFEIALANPLLGVGLDVFRTAGLEFRTIGNNSHSNYMEILASTGLIGALCYYAMSYCWWSRLVKAKALLRDARYSVHVASAVAIASTVLVLDVAWVSYYEKLIWLVLAGLIAEANLIDGARKSAGGMSRRTFNWTGVQ